MNRMTEREAARYIGVSRSFLANLRVIGGGPLFIKLGKKVLYEIADLDAWIKAHKQESTADIPANRPKRGRPPTKAAAT